MPSEVVSREVDSTTSKGRVLVIDDEPAIRESLQALLTLEGGYAVDLAESGAEGLNKLTRRGYDLVLLDLMMPDMSGMEVLHEVRERDRETPIFMITAYGSVQAAVDALKQRYSFPNIIGKSDKMLRVFDLVGQVASSRATILITGETGTGKELIAKAIHANSPRSDFLFIPVNSGSLPPDLLESTLFGHVKGAFTSALQTKKGYFEVANRGHDSFRRDRYDRSGYAGEAAEDEYSLFIHQHYRSLKKPFEPP
jgi:DNA-binding NtrC family response regulator